MRTITADFFTTINAKMFVIALNFLLNPIKWTKIRSGSSISKLEIKLHKYIKKGQISNSKIYSYLNGRTALYKGLKLIGAGRGDEVILQGFTCVSVCNAVIQTGAKPIYMDIENSLNINPDFLENKINTNTKAIIMQHSLGCPADIDKITKISKKHGIHIVEDCAHSLGSEYKGRKVGNFGDISFFSFGRDKVVSSVNGGFLLVNSQKLAEKINDKWLKTDNLPLSDIIKNIYYIIVSYLSKILYDFFGLGKVIIFLSRKLGLITEVLYPGEKICQYSALNYSLPNSLAEIGLSQFKNIDKYNKHRIFIAGIYNKKIKKGRLDAFDKKGNIYLRYPLLVGDRNKVIKICRSSGIIPGKWYMSVIEPDGADKDKCQYVSGSCPRAEEISSKIINLPNHIGVNEKEANYIIDIINKTI